ncbi:MAG: hypothetical protein AB7O74_09515 [Candidatus Nanopelagicales bacterium]
MTIAPQRPLPTTAAAVRQERPLGVMDVVPLPSWAIVLGALGATAVAAALAARAPLFGVAAAGAVAVALWLAQRPVLLGVVVVALVPITSGLKRGLGVPGLKISEVLVVFGAIVILGFAGKVLRGPRWRAWDWAALVYCFGTAAFGVLNSALQQTIITGDDINTMLGPVQFLLLYRTVAAAFPTVALRVVALRALVLASIPVSMLAVLQMVGPAFFQNLAVGLTGTGIFITPGYDPVMRATSLFPMWHPLGGYLVVVVLVVVALLLRRDTEVLATGWLFFVLAIAAASLVLTLTFTIIGGAVLGVLVVGWAVRRLKLVLTWLVVGGAAALVAFFPLIMGRLAEQQTATSVTPTAGDSIIPQTILYRLIVWGDQYLPALRGMWATGYGPADPPGISWDHTESGYITLLLRGGIPLLVAGALVIYLSWRAGRRLLAAATETTALSEIAIGASVVGIAAILPVVNFFFPYFTASGMPQPMWVVWGLLAAALGSASTGHRTRDRAGVTH